LIAFVAFRSEVFLRVNYVHYILLNVYETLMMKSILKSLCQMLFL